MKRWLLVHSILGPSYPDGSVPKIHGDVPVVCTSSFEKKQRRIAGCGTCGTVPQRFDESLTHAGKEMHSPCQIRMEFCLSAVRRDEMARKRHQRFHSVVRQRPDLTGNSRDIAPIREIKNWQWNRCFFMTRDAAGHPKRCFRGGIATFYRPPACNFFTRTIPVSFKVRKPPRSRSMPGRGISLMTGGECGASCSTLMKSKHLFDWGSCNDCLKRVSFNGFL